MKRMFGLVLGATLAILLGAQTSWAQPTGTPASLSQIWLDDSGNFANLTRTWVDANADYVPNCSILTVTANGECGASPFAGVPPVNFSFSASVATDPGPGGLPNIVTFTLPATATAGDVILNTGTGINARLRFNGDNRVFFYSNAQPSSNQANTITVVSTAGWNSYVPQFGQPGFGYNGGGVNLLTNYLTYTWALPQQLPRLLTVSPSSGSVAGGTVVTLRGLNFGLDVTATIDGSPAASLTRIDSTTLQVTTPPHWVKLTTVGITTGGQSRSLPYAFSYGPPAPIGAVGSVIRASLTSTGGQASSASATSAINADGRYVAFITSTGMVPSDLNARPDLYLRDTLNGTTEQINVDSSGQPAAGSFGPSAVTISADGLYVAFMTPEALEAADTSGFADIYVRDRTAGTTQRVSLTAAGSQLPGLVTGSPCMSNDGRYVAFIATGTGVTPDDAASGSDLFVRDRTANTTTMLSVGLAGTLNFNSSCTFSSSGRFIAFSVPVSGITAVMLRDRDTDVDGLFDEAGATSTVNLAPGQNGPSSGPQISADGRYVSFASGANNLVPNDTNGTQDVFLYDRIGSTTTRINLAPNGSQADGPSNMPLGRGLSADGRYVLFASAADNLVPFDGNAAQDVFRYDRLTNTTTLVSAAPDGSRTDSGGAAAGPGSSTGGITADGSRVVLASFASNLVAGDTNGVTDVFVKTIGVNTNTGSNVLVNVIDSVSGATAVTVQYASVTTAGTTSLVVSETGPAPPHNYDALGEPPAFLYLTTTATISGTVRTCVTYVNTGLPTANTQLMAWDGTVWNDVTVSNDTTNAIVCGQTTAFVPLIVANPTSIPTADLAIDFGDAGLWLLSGNNAWQQLHGVNPDILATGDLDGNGISDLAVDFGSYGLYVWMNHANWVLLHPGNATQLITADLDHNGHDDIIVAFPGYGLWRWSDGVWNQVHNLTPNRVAAGQFDAGAGEDLVIDFPIHGVYTFRNNTTWALLHPLNANVAVTADIDGNGRDEIIVGFPGYGLWAYRDSGTWAQLHGRNPTVVTTGYVDLNGYADLTMDFGNDGVWQFRNNSTWRHLHPFHAEGLLTADRDASHRDEVLLDFGPSGLWQFGNDSMWNSLHGLSPEGMVAGRLH